MDIVIFGHDVNVTQRLREYVETKMERLDRYMPNITELRVDLREEINASKIEDRQVAQVTLRNSRGTILRAEESSSDLYAAIDVVVDKLYRQIERYKGKRRRRQESTVDWGMYETAVELEDDELDDGIITRRKQFSVIPMHEEEAIEQMELLGHDFFVFVNADTNGVNVLYLRKHGDYGLIEPEFD